MLTTAAGALTSNNFADSAFSLKFAFRLSKDAHLARMAELVDALDSKSCGSNIVRVRFPLWALRMSFYDILFLFNTV